MGEGKRIIKLPFGQKLKKKYRVDTEFNVMYKILHLYETFIPT